MVWSSSQMKAKALGLNFFDVTHIADMSEMVTDGFDLNLNAARLVQFEGQEPIWVTEMEKACHLRH
jgi:hypothetical protein